ncbi:hypothetical protein MAHJHV57_54410 [Mycobacterium avium subsp. hominissuis]
MRSSGLSASAVPSQAAALGERLPACDPAIITELGPVLALKPLLRIDDGKLVLAQRVRTASAAAPSPTT